jgi:hypothetical protein
MSGEGFTTVRSLGGLLPPDLLRRVAQADRTLDGLRPDDYHLLPGETLRQAVSNAWPRVRRAWEAFRAAADRLAPEAAGTTETRERWLLPLFTELGYGRLPTARAIDAAGQSYPASHGYGRVPIHLVSHRVDLDTRTPGAAGAARWAPHAMVQELLNRSEDHLWGVVSHGLVLRLLRDNLAMTRQAYVEFDLRGMMDGESYADFVLLWLLCHQSRVEGDRSETCWLERWTETAQREGTRALDQLRAGVEKALATLGTGFLTHPANDRLRTDLRAGEVSPEDLYRQLLRLVYRLLFLFVAEDRELFLDPDTKPDARERYREHYSTRRLRQLARRIPGGAHDDLWQAHQRVVEALASDNGFPELALAPMGGQLFASELTPHLSHARLRNDRFLEAVRGLAWMEQDRVVQAVDYRNLGAEELGSIYESLLELHPEVSGDYRRFELTVAPGSERKTTGSYYTPDSLIQQLLDTALDPVVDRAAKQEDPEEALLELTVVDPACGSGHFLVAAARRIARRLASIRTGEGEPSPAAVQEAMRDVVPRCIHGVDINPMALELAKVSLWLEAHVPGKPLTFLDHHLRVGNSLLGATPGLLARGIPDDAFKPIEGDDKVAVKEQRKRNRKLRKEMEAGVRQRTLIDLAAEEGADYVTAITDRARDLENLPDDTLHALREKQRHHENFQRSRELTAERRLADAWCAAFTAPKLKDSTGEEPFEAFYRMRKEPETAMRRLDVVDEHAEDYGFFHWHLEFPHVFEPDPDAVEDADPTGWEGGFSVVVGNPPWEHTELKEKEFFATRHEEIASAGRGSDRKAMIEKLRDANNPLYYEYRTAKRLVDGLSHLARNSGRYPLCGTGRINTYALFAELNRQNTSDDGRSGFIVPTGIATDYTTRAFFAQLVEDRTLHSLYGFYDRGRLFSGADVHHFCLITLAGGEKLERPSFVFYAREIADISDPEKRFKLSPDAIALINPNTKTAPVFRTRRDAEIAAKIYQRIPVLIRTGEPAGNPWGLEFAQGLFNSTSDSELFRTRKELEDAGYRLRDNRLVDDGGLHLPLFEAKMVHQFDHRWATYDRDGSTRYVTVQEKRSKGYEPLPRFWVSVAEVEAQLDSKQWDADWLLGWRKTCRSTDERTFIGTIVPRVATNDKLQIMFPEGGLSRALLLLGAINSFAADYVTRLFLGGTDLGFFLTKQIAIPAPEDCENLDWLGRNDPGLAARVYELTFTSDRLAIGDHQAYTWSPPRRDLLRAELDAAFFHIYGLGRGEIDYVMETFPVVKRRDEQRHGEYRTKRLILEISDEMAKAIESGEPYETRLDPPPADPSLQHE